MSNFLSNYSPTGPRLNRVKYIQNIIMFVVFVFLAVLIIGVGALLIGGDSLYESSLQNFTKPLASLLVSFMFISLSIRRNHDVGISGWWILLGIIIPIYPLVFCFIPGTKGPNKYGPDPLEKLKTKN